MKSISTRLLVVVFAIFLVGMGLVAGTGTVLSASSISAQSLGRISEMTKSKAEAIDAWVQHQFYYIDAAAASLSAAGDFSADTLFPMLVAEVEQNSDLFCVYVGYPDGSGVFSDGWVPDGGWLATDRDWYLGAAADTENAYVTELYQDATTGDFCVTVSHAIQRNGQLVGVAAADIFTTVLSTVMTQEDGAQSASFLTDAGGNIIVHPNSDFNPVVSDSGDSVFKNLAEVENGLYAPLLTGELSAEPVAIRGADGMLNYYLSGTIASTGWVVYTSMPAAAVNQPIIFQIRASVAVFIAVLLVASAVIWIMVRRLIVKPVRGVTEAADRLSRGECPGLAKNGYVGEIAQLAESFQRIEAFNEELAANLEQIARGDLTAEMHPRGESDRSGLSVVTMTKNLGGTFRQLRDSAASVAGGAKRISEVSRSLAGSSAEQEGASDELSTAIVSITENAVKNTVLAEQATARTNEIKEDAERGGRQMDALRTAVNEINEAGQGIQRIIKVIDDIAFQTNILALNAAVEAARAGQHGKGFAVVADEVRSLAAKSAEAASETGSLIQNSAEKAALGVRITAETVESLQRIMTGIGESAAMVDEIASSHREQQQDVARIGDTVTRLSQIVRQTSATAQESAAASSEMSGQAETLERLSAMFKCGDYTPA